MVIQCKNLISLYILPDQRRGNLLVLNKTATKFTYRVAAQRSAVSLELLLNLLAILQLLIKDIFELPEQNLFPLMIYFAA